MRLWAGFAVLCVVCGVTGLFATTAAAQSQSTPTPADPRWVVEAYESARGAGDVDGALAEFSDTAVVSIQGRGTASFAGSKEVRTYLQSIGTRFQIVNRSKPIVEGTTISWTERDQFTGMALDASVVAIVSNGRIVSMTYRENQPATTRDVLSAAAGGGRPVQVPSVAWAAGVALLGLLLVALAFGLPRRRPSHSKLDGRLLVALQHERVIDLEHVERSVRRAA